MVSIVKQTRELGTSAGVLLPRSWLNKQVVVTLFSPSNVEMIKDILEILIENNLNRQMKGMYIYGSYARGDYDEKSDRDILIITKSVNKSLKHKNYEITLVSED